MNGTQPMSIDDAMVWLAERYFYKLEIERARQQADPAGWLAGEGLQTARGQVNERFWLETRRGYVRMWLNGREPPRQPDVEITIERVARLALGECTLQLSLFEMAGGGR
ncbi:MAG: hypothetical protein M1546_13605 [Chloroflexi bacterium]|nr:hypothetical protein [Chloroflexota bacterium]